MTFNHAYDFAFEVGGSTDQDGFDVTAQQLRAAILSRLGDMSDDELVEACGSPFDTMKEGD